MASKAVKAVNRTYLQRHVRKPAKGQGVYATQLPGFPSGIHAQRAKGDEPCRCGRCSNRAAA